MPYWLSLSPIATAAITASGSTDTPSASADQRSTGLFASSSGPCPITALASTSAPITHASRIGVVDWSIPTDCSAR